MKRVLFPDPLIWHAGTEYGLQAMAMLRERVDFVCVLSTDGPLLEAVSFAVYQLGLGERVKFMTRWGRWPRHSDLVLLPRVAALPEIWSRRTKKRAARGAKLVVTSEPGIHGDGGRISTVPRRDPTALAELLCSTRW